MIKRLIRNYDLKILGALRYYCTVTGNIGRNSSILNANSNKGFCDASEIGEQVEILKEFNKHKNEDIFLKYYQSKVSDITVKESQLMNWDSLHWASLKNHNNILLSIIKNRKKELSSNSSTEGEKIFTSDKFGVTPLHISIQRSNYESVVTLLENGCDVNKKDSKAGQRLSPLLLAVNQPTPDLRIIKKLIEYGANVNQEALDRKTALFQACSKSRLDIIEILLSSDKYSLSVNIQDNPKTNGWEYYRVTSPLHISVSKNDLEIVKILIEKANGNPNHTLMDDVGESLLHVAALNGDLNMLTYLLSKGANINALDCYDATPLDYADSGYNSNRETIDFLKTNNAKYGKGRKL
ncbi:hypothetical protein DLAC_10856 [Tieghemostelium lacteum]|uniref:Uncharacterized protein n=1 Tax=Tieghemostelium lacteum TaxID=361077 RepID=A0A151Z4F1_TIELA|nr:hypothetical protein DLAC_10856 [Tieghemostelium lacteum]|eukprot:KYQ88674.1 hypothetical protein DLAC_10856 [Tieghemostelium lacteum]